MINSRKYAVFISLKMTVIWICGRPIKIKADIIGSPREISVSSGVKIYFSLSSFQGARLRKGETKRRVSFPLSSR